jgi:hypothetical protein
MIRKITAAAAGAGLLFLCSASCYAIDGVGVEVGHGDDRTSLLRIVLTDRWHKAVRKPENVWRLAGYWELEAGVWDNPEESTAEIGITPVFRIERAAFYVEGAVGAHLVQAQISAHRTFSTALQFGSHAGIGIHTGKVDFGVRVQHLSNGGVSSPNPGINFVLLRMHYDLE